MPYIDAAAKERLRAGDCARTPGELTYMVTLHAMSTPDRIWTNEATNAILAEVGTYVQQQPTVNYTVLSAVIGVLECAARELLRRGHLTGGRQRALLDAQSDFYRNVIAPYEDDKIAENGDVF